MHHAWHVHHAIRLTTHIIFGAYLLSRPQHTTVVYVGTTPNYYANGVYYVKKSETCYVTVPPPSGAVVTTLPEGAVQAVHGGETYHYWSGSWYIKGDKGYQVVMPPVGITATFLPKSAKKQTVDGTTYFVYAGIYYVAKFVDGLTLYQVVAKPGAKRASADVIESLPSDKINVKEGDKTYYFVDGDWFADAKGGYTKAAAPVGASVPYLPDDAKQKDGYFVAKGVYYKTYSKDGVELYRVAEKPS